MSPRTEQIRELQDALTCDPLAEAGPKDFELEGHVYRVLRWASWLREAGGSPSRAGGKRSSKGSEQGRPPLWFLLPRGRVHRPAGSGATRKPQPCKECPTCGRSTQMCDPAPEPSPAPFPTWEGRPPHPRTYQVWATPVQTPLRASPPPCPRPGGGPLRCTPGLGQTGSPGRLRRAWWCALAPRSFSGRAGPPSQGWRQARRHQERRRREALLDGAAALRICPRTDGEGWEWGAPAGQEGQDEHRVRLRSGRAGLHL